MFDFCGRNIIAPLLRIILFAEYCRDAEGLLVSFTNFLLSKTCKNQINRRFFCKTLSCVFRKFQVLGSKQDIPNLFLRVEFRFACKNVRFLEENYDKIYVCFCRGTCVNAYRLLLKSQISILRGVFIQFLLKFPNF